MKSSSCLWPSLLRRHGQRVTPRREVPNDKNGKLVIVQVTQRKHKTDVTPFPQGRRPGRSLTLVRRARI